MNIKTNASKIPNGQELQERLLAYAKIDYIMNYDDEFSKVYHYDDKNWVKDGHYFRIDDSCGDRFHVLISPAGTAIKGFGHETEMSPYNFSEEDTPALIRTHNFYKDMPPELFDLVNDPALEINLATFCVWQKAGEENWSYAPIDIPDNWADGTEDFLKYVSPPSEYLEWFAEYYEEALNEEILDSIYKGEEISREMVAQIPTEHDTAVIRKGLAENF